MIDLIIVSSDLRRSLEDVRVKIGVELSTDHHLVAGTLRCKKCSTIRRSGGRSSQRIRWALCSVDTSAKFPNSIVTWFEHIPVMTTDVETEWQLFKCGIFEAAAECCGFKRVGPPLGVKEKKAVFKKWLGNEEVSTSARYVEAARRQQKHWEAEADFWEKFGELLD
ncbi:unnamed protein product [Soboliphyme baturini]|uniref:Myb_DNA-bind_3 domain-containing protein n=1 Tax=Soboliphyme baturini TaxID=241478 RepID=A0A183ICC4_9BILA|nr:unnamed protein product [Soboliphyme baturini]